MAINPLSRMRSSDDAIDDIRRRFGRDYSDPATPTQVVCLACLTRGQRTDAVLIVDEARGEIGYSCPRGCSQADVFARAGVTLSDLTFAPTRPPAPAHPAGPTPIRPDVAPDQSGGVGDPTPAAPPAWRLPLDFDTPVDRPPFPVEALPPWVGQFVWSVAEATQTPVDLAAMIATAALALIASRKYEVEVWPGYIEPVNIWAVVALGPGNRKSAVFKTIMAAVYEWQAEQDRRLAVEQTAANDRLAIIEASIKSTQARIGKEHDGETRAGLERDLADLRQQQTETVAPANCDLTLDDVTQEALAAILGAGDERAGIFSPEGTIFKILAGRYAGAPNLELFLAAHAGDRYTVHRDGGKRRQVLHSPALTMAIAPQPAVLRSASAIEAFRDQGFLGRILYALPHSPIGSRQIRPDPCPSDYLHQWRTGIRALLRLPWPDRWPDDTYQRSHRLCLTPDAQQYMVDLATVIEPRLGPGGDLAEMIDWSAKLHGAIARIMAILHIAGSVYPHAMDPGDAVSIPLTIGVDVADAAGMIGAYLVAHAQAAYQMMADPDDDDLDRAKRTWATICVIEEGRRPERVGQRELYQRLKGGAGFARVEDVTNACRELVKRGYLRPNDTKSGRGWLVSPLAAAIDRASLPPRRFRRAAGKE